MGNLPYSRPTFPVSTNTKKQPNVFPCGPEPSLANVNHATYKEHYYHCGEAS